jgi:hypothetical protein
VLCADENSQIQVLRPDTAGSVPEERPLLWNHWTAKTADILEKVKHAALL